MAGYYLDLRFPGHRPVTAALPRTVDATNEARVRLDLLAALCACTPHVRGLIIDMTRTRFIDSAGLRALLVVRSRAAELGVSLCLAAPRDDVLPLLGLVDIAGRVPVFASVDAALTAWSTPPDRVAVAQ
jgi:anti-anti-sigma factor